jgi:hypothetical protein
MQSSAKVHAPGSRPRQPGFVRVCFDSLAPAQLLWRLLLSADPQLRDTGMRAPGRAEQQSYCLVDARIDDDTRCATIFQTSPRYQLILGGVYLARHLETGSGSAYLKFLCDPRLASEPAASVHEPQRTEETTEQTIDSALSVILLTQGDVLRSATLKDLTHLTAEQNYVRLHLLTGENVLVRGPLQKYENVLPDSFIRASRHLIINLDTVQRLRRVSRDLGLVYFAGAKRHVRLGRKASIGVRAALLNRSSLPLSCSGRLAGNRGRDQALG